MPCNDSTGSTHFMFMLSFGPPFEAHVGQALRRGRLRALPPGVIRSLRVGERRLDVPAGTLLPLPCDQPHLGLVVDGVLRVSIASDEGRLVTLRYLRPGDLVGAPSLVGQATSIADFRAVVDTSILVFEVERASELARSDARVAMVLAEELGLMLRSSIAGLVTTAFGSVRQRIARHLLDLAVSFDRDGRGVAEVSQQDLADAVGSVREVVARNLAQLRDERRIATRPGRIVLLDPEGLATVARAEEQRATGPTLVRLAG